MAKKKSRSTIRKTPARKRSVGRAKKKAPAAKKRRRSGIGNVSYHLKIARDGILKAIEDKEGKRFVAKKKSAKKKIGKEIRALKAQYNKIK